MSRSTKKAWRSVCNLQTSEMKKWKRNCNQLMRRIPFDEEMPKFNQYKKLNDVWNSPSDGKMFCGDDTKWTRK